MLSFPKDPNFQFTRCHVIRMLQHWVTPRPKFHWAQMESLEFFVCLNLGIYREFTHSGQRIGVEPADFHVIFNDICPSLGKVLPICKSLSSLRIDSKWYSIKSKRPWKESHILFWMEQRNKMRCDLFIWKEMVGNILSYKMECKQAYECKFYVKTAAIFFIPSQIVVKNDKTAFC